MPRTRIRGDQEQDISFVSEEELNQFLDAVVITGTEDATAVVQLFDDYFPGRGLIVGVDGNTAVTGTQLVTISGFRGEFLSASGTLVKKTGDTMAGPLIIGVTDSEALLVRNAADTTDILTVDTSLESVDIRGSITQIIGVRNVIIGEGAGSGGVGQDTVLIGYNVGTGGSNFADRDTFIGSQAGESIVNGLENTLIGYRSGASLVASVRNVLIGAYAGESSDRNDNVMIGTQAGQSSTTSLANVLIGYQAGKDQTTGGSNVYIGYRAGAVASGSSNTVVGQGAGSNLKNGNNNVFIGRNAGAGTTDTLGSNVYIGANAADSNAAGVSNTIIGANAGGGTGATYSNTTIVGQGAGVKLTTGTNNLFFGNSVGINVTEGGDNILFQAGGKLSTGGVNILLGRNVFSNISGSNSNIGIGFQAGRLAENSDENIIIGVNAGSAGSFSGDGNILIGHTAGRVLATASRNIFIGHDAGRYQTNVSDRLIIDNRDQGSEAAELTGALIVGNFNATPSSQTIQFNADTTVTYGLAVGAGVAGTTEADGIIFGSGADVNLYRSAANTLKTDDNFIADKVTAASGIFSDTLTVSGIPVNLVGGGTDADTVSDALIGGTDITVTSGSNITTIDWTGIDNDTVSHALIGGTDITVTSGSNTITVDWTGTDNDTVSDALTGSDGITITSGSNTTDIAGFRDEFLSASGTFLKNIVEDLTPQLGGDLDVNGKSITSAGNVDINIRPAGTGGIELFTGKMGGNAASREIWIATSGGGDIYLDAVSNSNTGDIFIDSGGELSLSTANLGKITLDSDGFTDIIADRRLILESVTQTIDIKGSLGIWLTGDLRVDNGSAATPSISFKSDGDTGMYRKGTNQLGFGGRGREILTVTGTVISTEATQGVGIDGNLTVTGTVAADLGTFETGLTVSGIPVRIDSSGGTDNDTVSDALIGGTDITVTSGSNIITVDWSGTDSDTVSDAIIGGTNTTVTSGTNIITIDGATLTKSISIEAPTASEDISWFFTPVAITVTEVTAVSVGTTPSTTISIMHNTNRNNAGNNVLTSATATTSTTTGDNPAIGGDTTIPLDSFVWLETSAQTGTVTNLLVSLTYTED